MFICGTGSFTHEEDDLIEYCPKSKKTKTFRRIPTKNTSNKNPYANRGLDKFYALLADLDNKKQMIYTQKGSEDISFVRFVYTNRSNRIRPIVVKVKEKKPEKNNSGMIKKSFKNSMSDITSDKVIVTTEVPKEEMIEKPMCLKCRESFKLEKLNRPYFYLSVMTILILMFIAMYGRSFAILCMSIGWYVGPNVSSSSSDERKPTRKKIGVHSEGPASPKSVISGLMEIK